MKHFPKPRHLWLAAKKLWPAIVAGAGIVAVAFIISVGLFGFSRIYHDFIPLDSSPVGPNLVASIFVVTLVAGHNEYRTIRRDEEEGKSIEQTLEDAAKEVLHPTEVAEEHIAQDVVEQQGEANAGT